MTIEQNIKTYLGEYIFQVCVLQSQLEEANNNIKELTEKVSDDTARIKS